MTWLDKDIARVEHNVKTYGALYSKEDLAHVKRILAHLKQLKLLKRGTK